MLDEDITTIKPFLLPLSNKYRLVESLIRDNETATMIEPDLVKKVIAVHTHFRQQQVSNKIMSSDSNDCAGEEDSSKEIIGVISEVKKYVHMTNTNNLNTEISYSDNSNDAVFNSDCNIVDFPDNAASLCSHVKCHSADTSINSSTNNNYTYAMIFGMSIAVFIFGYAVGSRRVLIK